MRDFSAHSNHLRDETMEPLESKDGYDVVLFWFIYPADDRYIPI